MPIIVKDLVYTYLKDTPLKVDALNGVNLVIGDGEFVGIIGQTGSGKTTLVQHFNGLLKPTSGSVNVNGMDATGKNLKELRRQVGLVFQYPEHQLFEETVAKDIAFGMKKIGVTPEKINENIKWAIKTVGLSEDILDKSPFEISGGQKRRVAIAGVLVMEPKILILDEPAAGLDPSGRDDILANLSDMHRNLGITVILVSHSMEDIAKFAHRVIVMNDGSVQMDGSVREVFRRSDELEQLGLQPPQINALARKLSRIIPGFNSELITVAEAKNEIVKFLAKGGEPLQR
ncbi:MAG: energy-coupling factor transporter ATPase [Eubacteriales bacterium]|nr:energy-coupling factor transporter ATPase [Eubacteriales bacterium]